MAYALVVGGGTTYLTVDGNIHTVLACGRFSVPAYLSLVTHWLARTEEGKASGLVNAGVLVRALTLLQTDVFDSDTYAELETEVRKHRDMFQYGQESGLLPASGVEWARTPDGHLNVFGGLWASLQALVHISTQLFLDLAVWAGRWSTHNDGEVGIEAPSFQHFSILTCTVWVDPDGLLLLVRKAYGSRGDVMLAMPGSQQHINKKAAARLIADWCGPEAQPSTAIAAVTHYALSTPQPPPSCLDVVSACVVQ